MKHIFFSFVSALAFLACKQPAPDPRRSLDCYLRYDAPNGLLRAEATFRDEASLPIGEVPGGISLRGAALRKPRTPNLPYSDEYATAFNASNLLEWESPKGTKRTFSLEIAPVTGFGFGSTTILRQQPATLSWEGAPLSKGESLVLMWENIAARQALPMELYNASSEAKIEFPAAKLAELQPGTWSLYLVRKRLTKSEIGNTSLSAVTEYYSHPIELQVRD
jgi:hypothetical protein